MIDTHAHLTDERFAVDSEAVLARAGEAGLVAVLDVGCDLTSSAAALVRARANQESDCSRPRVFATVGYHPHDARLAPGDYLERLEVLAGDSLVVAIGEIGLDYHYDFSPRETQREVFAAQLRLAAKLRLPVIVHDREAHADTMTIIKAEAAGRCAGVMHCYSGGLEQAEEYLAMGFYLSVGGPVTFNNARRLVEVVRQIPLERLLLETDCPYLAPVPRRGERNEPANVTLVAERVGEIRGLAVEEIGRITTANAVRLFRLPGELAGELTGGTN